MGLENPDAARHPGFCIISPKPTTLACLELVPPSARVVGFSLEQVLDSMSSVFFWPGAIGFVARKSIDVLSEL